METLQKEKEINEIVFISQEENEIESFNGCTVLNVGSVFSGKAIKAIADYGYNEKTSYIMLCTKASPVQWGYQALSRLSRIAENTEAQFLYSDYYQIENGKRVPHPVIDCQFGSLRDDFDFGSVYVFRLETFKEILKEKLWVTEDITEYQYAALYYMRLHACVNNEKSRSSEKLFVPPVHIKEFLYTQEEMDTRLSGEKQFDYVNPKNREVQIEMEKVCTNYLIEIEGYLPPRNYNYLTTDLRYNPLSGASVIIPVRNRVRTIGDAIQSALQQECDREYNIIVVDNHSTDGTSEMIEQYAAKDSRVIHLIPEQDDLGIGGCWNLAIHHPACKDIAIQLDSDDLYNGNDVIQKILSVFESTQCAMVIGSYRMTDFNLNTLPPGVIDHKEWTADNGRNNALRINGLGAPRAFYTPIVREMPFPNTCYGEDYAMALAISRSYKIERIYDVLYLCRRWEGNSDAALSIEKVNANNLYKDSIRSIELAARIQLMKFGYHRIDDSSLADLYEEQMKLWPLAKTNHEALNQLQTRTLDENISLQFNPCRSISTGAKTEASAIAKRPCFLCDANRPKEQISLKTSWNFKTLVNPYPIMPYHFTVVSSYHMPQTLSDCLIEMVDYTNKTEEYTFIYNGAKSGASAPDHAHFQAFKGELPIFEAVKNSLKNHYPIRPTEAMREWRTHLYALTDTLVPMFVITDSSNFMVEQICNYILQCLPVAEGEAEPRLNVISKKIQSKRSRFNCYIIIPRSKHRPDCYGTEREDQVMVSPGAIDMGGLIITPREEDFNKITLDKARSILQEVAISKEDMEKAVKKLKEIIKNEGA